jgi:colicin import membrane protein
MVKQYIHLRTGCRQKTHDQLNYNNKMKTRVIFLLLILTAVALPGGLLAQTTNQKKEATEAKTKSPEKKPAKKVSADKNKGKDKGNSYGQQKEGMSGREFGQQRSAEARAKEKKELEDSDAEMEAKEKEIVTRKTKIQEALEELEKKKATKTVNDKEYQDQKKTLEEEKATSTKSETEVKTIRTRIREKIEQLKQEEALEKE